MALFDTAVIEEQLDSSFLPDQDFQAVQEESPGYLLGDVSASYESQNTIGTISSGVNDPGGKSYGLHQLSSEMGTLGQFVEQSTFSEELSQSPIGSSEFDHTWKEISTQHSEEFKEDQREFVKRTYYDPARKLADRLGLPDTHAVNEALFSLSVQHGNYRRILRGIDSSMSEEDLIKEIYERRRQYVSSLGLRESIKSSLMSRYEKEIQDVLKLMR